MPKLPREVNGGELAAILIIFNYSITRQTGSHIRLTSNKMGFEIGTLNNILNELAEYLLISKKDLIKELFK
jgi:hypothetical protein